MINFYQRGGQVDPITGIIEQLSSDDPQQQQQGIATLSELQDADQVVQEIATRAQQGDAKATKAVQLIQQVIEASKAQAQKAEHGAKLNYIKKLQGICPEGYETYFFKAGGQMCRGMKKKKCGGKVKKGEEGLNMPDNRSFMQRIKDKINGKKQTNQQQNRPRVIVKDTGDNPNPTPTQLDEANRLKKEKRGLLKSNNPKDKKRVGEINNRLVTLLGE